MVTDTYPYGYDTNVPSIVTEICSSRTNNQPTTLSNFFDIQWRRYITQIDYNHIIDNGSTYLAGAYRPLQSVILNNAIESVEGLIVDTVNGGIGFRNHTVPSGVFANGGSSPGPNRSTFVENVALTDPGGFVNLGHPYPEPNQSNPTTDAQLWMRASKAEYMSNGNSTFYYNVSNPADEPEVGMKAFSYVDSYVGKTFPVQTATASSAYDSLSTDQYFSDFFSLLLNHSSSQSPHTKPPPNPFGINSTPWQDLEDLCSRYYGNDNTYINNGTNSLQNLIVTDILDKLFTSDTDKPIWGLISQKFEDHRNVSSLGMSFSICQESTIALVSQNLIWTDYAASVVTGTKEVLGAGNSGVQNTSIAVTPLVRRVCYQLLYALPALITGFILILFSGVALGLSVLSPISIATIPGQINLASTGRILTTCLYPQQCDIYAQVVNGAEAWVKPLLNFQKIQAMGWN
ncbi:hypothetical protein BGW36DRAFT_355285 [Talaromyces proteolyticus]|uniref:Uncharacterized protein n=1 Tax=Talaromyces proteolyticus TaxID=1131652 RepID=A0AAD4L461_9EURO|nr:uncharacterized protein BGW36DRAFT_355285 [Talaromyces proteolyticus]KAH8703888.1 hypothetical protein BGW36DRAFT_355285 [Talaromyces proteolyticus]